ncbi:hypothetical protein PLESTB_001612800 [Pleodorina starrii]|uniref:Integrase catalytic domain-containing protein n=1 Tax=Pleodorina starrii TaxID=330485 RepID=A0A9W6BYZ4_9CHLO|nr:hypothetical protein PLESTB_001612800 [Pleodorina starrii]
MEVYERDGMYFLREQEQQASPPGPVPSQGPGPAQGPGSSRDHPPEGDRGAPPSAPRGATISVVQSSSGPANVPVSNAGLSAGDKAFLNGALRKRYEDAQWFEENAWRRVNHEMAVESARVAAEKKVAHITRVAKVHSERVKEREEKRKALLLHRRLGHAGFRSLTRLSRGGVPTGVSRLGIRAAQRTVCEPCALGKQTQQPHPSTGHVAARRLDQVHMDVGVMPITSAGGKGYFATFYDEFTKFSEVRCIARKSDVPQAVREVLTLWQTQTGDKVRRVHTDRGTEYVNNDLLAAFKDLGILHEKTAPYSPEQNGAAERLNRTLMDRVRAMLIDSGQPQEMWGEAILTANLLRNVTPTSDSLLTPWERFTGQKPDLSRLRVFGSVAYVMVPGQKRKKLDPVAIKGVMVGYEGGLSAWRIWDPVAQQLHLSTDAVFDEKRRWGRKPQQSFDSDSDSSSVSGPEEEEENESGPDTDPDADGDGPGDEEEDESSGDGRGSVGEPEGADPPDSPPGGDPQGDANPEGIVRRSARMNKGKMPARYVGTVASEVPVPTTADEAKASPYEEFWVEAMEEEMASHRTKGTFTLVQAPPGVRPLGSKWVFSLKQDENGVVERFKARWVVKGFMQREGVDFEEVFAPVSKQSTLRAFLSMVAAGNMELHQLDVKTAFLNGELEEEIYVTQPPGFEVGGPNVVARLHKALYGLCQASRTWYKTLHERLTAMGYEQSAADPSLYVRIKDGEKVYVLVYVDDVLVASVSHELVLQAKAELMRQFECRDMGEASVFLGMEIKRDREHKTLALSQKRMVSELVSSYGMEGAQPKPVPMAQGTVLVKASSEERLDRGRCPYSELVGSLLYIAGCTRPDISYAVGVLTRHMANPSMAHWKAAKEVVRYLAGRQYPTIRDRFRRRACERRNGRF